MVKLFVTGDNHIGRKYDRYPMVKDLLVQTRFDCLEDMVKCAEAEKCDAFVVTGDLFDNVNLVKVADIKKVADILSKFSGTILVLPGNHDYYTGDEKVWRVFTDEMYATNANFVFLNDYISTYLELGDDSVALYPAYCDSKHSKENKLAWIKKEAFDRDSINIGIAHGAIAGVTPDVKEEYFLMTEKELQGISVDAWLLGHTHIPYPATLSEEELTFGYSIFNPGTHAQTDLHNNTEGYGFIIEISKKDGIAKVGARKYVSGAVRFYDLVIDVMAKSETSLTDAISDVTCDLGKESVVRIKIKGLVKKSEYLEKSKIYSRLLGRFLAYEIEDNELSEEITIDTIRSEYAETSFAAKFMEQLVDEPVELQMVYQLVNACKEE